MNDSLIHLDTIWGFSVDTQMWTPASIVYPKENIIRKSDSIDTTHNDSWKKFEPKGTFTEKPEPNPIINNSKEYDSEGKAFIFTFFIGITIMFILKLFNV